ncbi:hypothetical protein PG991_000489 [Apiospora marii]|uniref:Heterokaryon incompatibility domain-containing protein n=1 Tax=Apiospora marii TaxID=335849 RepID=A0ABR1T3S4_9PEZI
MVQSTSPSGVVVKIMGPIYLLDCNDSLYGPDWEQTQRRHIEQSLPLGIWILLDVSFQPEPQPDDPTQAGTDSEMPETVSFTPRIRAYYAQDDTLYNVEDGNVPHFDISTMKGWLRFCEENHGPKCMGIAEPTEEIAVSSKPNRPRSSQIFARNISSIRNKVTKVIARPTVDRFFQNIERRILPNQDIQSQPATSKGAPDTRVAFVALSYMWNSGGVGSCDLKLEKANIEDLVKPGSLTESTIPKVIIHAISLCRDLGKQFLWVYRLCIVQDDEDTKSIQIQAMGSIYRSASFTIIAALDSRTTNTGLPGHAEQARRPWSSAFRPPLKYNRETVDPNGLRTIADPSMWNRRGWTFQERLLSRRCLFITEYQAIFQCSSAVAEEEFTWDRDCPTTRPANRAIQEARTDSNECSAPLRLPEQPGLPGMPGRVEAFTEKHFFPDMPTFESYQHWVKDYSSRELTFETDILKAFSGVANVIATGFGSRMLFGLPERILPQCIRWTCDGALVRRGSSTAIPSWSWASCAKPVNYKFFDEKIEANMCSIVQYYYQDPDEGLRELAIEQRWMDHVITISALGKLERLPPLTSGKALPAEWRSNSIWRDCVHNPWQAASRTAHDPEAIKVAAALPGSLVFNTTVATVYIGDLEGDDGDGKTVSFHNASGEVVGHFPSMGRDWSCAQQSLNGDEKAIECVVLGGYLAPYRQRKWLPWIGTNDPMIKMTVWKMTVMLVERLSYKPFVARRVAVGTVNVCSWNTSSPRWETVVLC